LEKTPQFIVEILNSYTSGYLLSWIIIMAKTFISVLKKYWKDILKISLIVLVSATVAVYISGVLKTDKFKNYVEELGFFGPLLVILYIAVSQVIAPLTGTPGTVVAVSSYGFWGGWLIIYIASLLSAVVNFYIARDLGRSWVIRLSGKESIEKIDKFVAVMGDKILIVARLFGFSVFEFISYAVGFTNMSFKEYFLITAIVSPISGTIVTYFFYRYLTSALALSVVLGTTIVIGAIFTSYMIWLYKKMQYNKG
jgi:uncharacterized membrane protein YdjX (TVP38/TMEM64 family)